MKNMHLHSLRNFNRVILNPIIRKLIEWKIVNHPLVYHIGRRSGKVYATPALARKRDKYIFIPITYGTDCDWYQNIKTSGQCQIMINKCKYSVTDPELVSAKDAEEAFPNNARSGFRINYFLRLLISTES